MPLVARLFGFRRRTARLGAKTASESRIGPGKGGPTRCYNLPPAHESRRGADLAGIICRKEGQGRLLSRTTSQPSNRRKVLEQVTDVFERFTERARQVVVLAQEEARQLKHNYIGTEHILLGLLREEEGLAARVLESLDITVERVRSQVVRIVGSGEEVTAGQIPFTPRAKKVLELALREA